MLSEPFRRAFDVLGHRLAEARAQPRVESVGTVQRVFDGVALLEGLPHVEAEELLSFPQGLMGLATRLSEREVGAILLGESGSLAAGPRVRRAGRIIDVPVGEALLGRVIDGLGRPLDDRGAIRSQARAPIESDAPAIISRAPVTHPVQTGLKVVDALVPIGRGQRELILGDRQTGKTAIALDTILNQRDVISIYCAIGQRMTAVARVIDRLKTGGAMERSIVVVAGGTAPPGQQYVAPYAATAIGEYFMRQGKDVLIVYDDLTHHARAYRELSLLLERPPGREAFPGDIFYIHSRLLERATHLKESAGGGSLTALPIIETEAQNISAYIPTNLISITDGQIYLSPDLFQEGQLPAVDVGRSVSRVGGKTQLPAYRAIAGQLRLSYAQFEELETFARFGTRLDEATRQALRRGRRVRAALRQGEAAPLPVPEQIVVLNAAASGILDSVPLERMAEAERAIEAALRSDLPDIADRIADGGTLEAADWERLQASARQTLEHKQLAAGEKDNGAA